MPQQPTLLSDLLKYNNSVRTHTSSISQVNIRFSQHASMNFNDGQ